MVMLMLRASVSSQGLGQAAFSDAFGEVPPQSQEVQAVLSPELESQAPSPGLAQHVAVKRKERNSSPEPLGRCRAWCLVPQLGIH